MTLDKQQLNSSQTNVNNGEVNADNCYIMSNCKENKERSSELSKKERERVNVEIVENLREMLTHFTLHTQTS